MRLVAISAPAAPPPKAGLERAASTLLRMLHLLGSQGIVHNPQGLALRCLDLHRIALEVQGRPPAGPVVLVANHLGYLDPLLVMSVAPAVAIAKAELAGWPLIGPVLTRQGVLFVQRDRPESGARALRAAARALAAGRSVLNFPEGTTSEGRALLPFKRGIFGLAQRLKVPVVPIWIELPTELAWVGEQSFLPHYLRLLARPEITARIRFGGPLDPDGEPAALAERARAAIWTLGGRR